MSNNFYNHGSFPTTGSAATSASMRAELDAIAAGFDKMPTLTGNANEIVVVNSSGTALTAIPTLPATSGGTGFASYAVGDLLYAATTTALAKLADVVTGNALISGGVGVAPSWGKIGLTTHVTGTLPATNGGTGFASYAVGDLLFASTTTALSALADVATGNALISGGVGVAPSYGKIGLTTHVSGTLPTANGGTNLTSFTANGVVYASSTSALATGSALTFDGSTLATTGALTVDGNTTLGNASTDTVTVNGYIGVGVAPNQNINIFVQKPTVGASQSQASISTFGYKGSSDASSITGVAAYASSAAAATTIANVYGLQASVTTKGAGSTITNAHAIQIPDLSEGTNNFGITSLVSSGTNKWNIYASGTAANYFAGTTLIGTTASQTVGNGNVNPNLLIETPNAGASLALVRNTATVTGGILVLGKSRGAAAGSRTAVNNGDNLGEIRFDGADGTSMLDAASFYVQADGAPTTGSVPGRLVFGTTAAGGGSPTERMRIDSAGNVGIGTSSPTYKTVVSGGSSDSILAIHSDTNSSPSAKLYLMRGTTDTFGGDSYTDWSLETSGADLIIQSATSSVTSERVRFDSAGNLGLGVTPSAWGGGFKAVDLNTYGAIGSTTGTTSIFGNAYYNGTNYIYKQTSAATFYDQALGLHRWWNAPNGTAGNAITFTQAMTLDASGRLLIGATSVRSGQGYPLYVETTSTTGGFFARNSADAVGTVMKFAKSRATSVGGVTTVTNNDTLGDLYFSGTDGTGLVDGARIIAAVDGTVTTGGMPTRLAFSTSAAGSSSPTERMRIDSSGNINIATAGARITGDFSNATVANRVAFQSSTTNGATDIPIIPNGTATNARHFYYSTNDLQTLLY